LRGIKLKLYKKKTYYKRIYGTGSNIFTPIIETIEIYNTGQGKA
jgi:hypothetical protein